MDERERQLRRYAADKAPWLREVIDRVQLCALPSFAPFCGVYLPFLRRAYILHDEFAEVEFGTCVHELRHAWQRYRYGLFLYIVYKAFCRKSLEADAEKEELDAVKWRGEQRLLSRRAAT